MKMKLVTAGGRKAWVERLAGVSDHWVWRIDHKPYAGDQMGWSRSRSGAMVKARNALCTTYNGRDYLTGKWVPD